MKEFLMTPLETAVLDRFRDLYGKDGFPAVDKINVVGRQVTPSGRYVHLASDNQTQIEDGYLDLGGSYIELDGLPNGLMAVVTVERRRVKILEFASYGGESWDGSEHKWAIV